MTRIRIPCMSWVLVCDGAKALIFRNRGDDDIVVLETVDVMVEPHPPARELGSDRPGRVRESGSASRSAVAEINRHDEAEATFLARVAERLDERLGASERRGLIVVAPPRVLGLLRGRLTPGARDNLTAEIAKDLAHLATAEIEKHLSEAQRRG
ncbi:host attachment protein [Hansschlegelia zhihuaiae]|uniref:Host attachment protein n=1 Tax=Hansschlegelia zhihuaiae TaxID=405005 RepID=A0A4Q0M9L1_9HYPH|nr:host attachment family protein [Hansschlegelia zhihuaiae]RXF69891.1 host attachment protein [Hansschlegelia zhihuaiae]